MRNDYIPYRNGTLLIPSGPSNHLFVILTEANDDNEHLLVSVTTIPDSGFYDPTCILTESDHPFIRHDSYVFYRKAQILKTAKITRLVDKKYYVPRDDMAEELTQIILDGVLESDFTPNFCKNFLR